MGATDAARQARGNGLPNAQRGGAACQQREAVRPSGGGSIQVADAHEDHGVVVVVVVLILDVAPVDSVDVGW